MKSNESSLKLIEKFDIPDLYHPFFVSIIEQQVVAIKNTIKKAYTPNILNVFRFLPKVEPRIVIIGQDPYPKNGLATGIAFGVDEDVQLPPSLLPIKEVCREYNIPFDKTFISWRDKGVMLVNSSLTTEIGSNLSHKNLWNDFMINFISYIDSNFDVKFILLGKIAQEFKKHIIHSEIYEDYHPVVNSYTGNKLFTGNGFHLIKELFDEYEVTKHNKNVKIEQQV